MPISQAILSCNNNDLIWVSKDMIEPYSQVITGEYYCISENCKLEFYEKQKIYDKKLFRLMYPTFMSNKNRKWYQFWKPSKIIDGYAFLCIDLEVKNE